MISRFISGNDLSLINVGFVNALNIRRTVIGYPGLDLLPIRIPIATGNRVTSFNSKLREALGSQTGLGIIEFYPNGASLAIVQELVSGSVA